MSKKPDDQYSEAETKKRMEAALRGARVAGSRPMTGDTKKPVKPKRRRKSTRS